MKQYFETNRKNWNTRVQAHENSKYYAVDAFLDGATSLKSIEINELGDIRGKRILHLQCHFGLDTLSLAKEGASVVGVDLSDEAITLAKKLSEKLGVQAEFICSNILELDEVLDDQFDIVFSSYGILCWIPDLVKWFNISNKFLKPGGKLILIDGHPINNLLEMNDSDELEIKYSYFDEGVSFGEAETTYADDEGIAEHKDNYQWSHSISDIIMSSLKAGLSLEKFEEFPYATYKKYPSMIEREDKYWELPEYNLPLLYLLKLTK